MADEFLTLYSVLPQPPAIIHTVPLERSNDHTLERLDHSTMTADGHHVQFDELVHSTPESGVYEARFAAEFSKDAYGTMHFTKLVPLENTFDCSHIHLSYSTTSPALPGFCLDIGAPQSVVGRKELDKILN